MAPKKMPKTMAGIKDPARQEEEESIEKIVQNPWKYNPRW